MAELVATGAEPDQKWHHGLQDGQTIRLGRQPLVGWAVPWDLLISREHADIAWHDGRLTVRQLENARNPVLFQGKASAECKLAVGDEFQIGRTRFRVIESAKPKTVAGSESPLAEHSYGRQDLKKFSFKDSDHRLDVLSKLPQLISGAPTDEDLASELVALVLQAIPQAEAAALLQCDDIQSLSVDDSTKATGNGAAPGAAGAPASKAEPKMIQWESRNDDVGRFRPSRRLIQGAIERGESILHVWSDEADAAAKKGPTTGSGQYTFSGSLDWAFCTPILGEACEGWCLYVSGRSSAIVSDEDLKADVRFTELLAQFIGAIRQVRMLEHQRAGMKQFFSKSVMSTLAGRSSESILTPKESDITVLFCDMRGFSKKSEQSKHDLHALLARVTEALSIMTHGILEQAGVIADFQGDAALGFWGWPKTLADGPLPACRAALAIHREFIAAVQSAGGPLGGFRVGIGIAHGRAIAGKIGTADQAKVGVFGPVVNLGSRLEGLTKRLRVPIVLDDATAEWVRRELPPNIGRCRRLARVRPYGMSTQLTVSELLPPDDHPGSISDDDVARYEQAVDLFIEGRWSETLELLGQCPVRDRAKDFLMIFIAENNYEPPDGWDGTINLAGK